MNIGQNQTIITISKIMQKGRKHYIAPRPSTMVELLAKFHKHTVSLQTYWRYLKDLEDEDYINRQSRWNTTDRNNPRRRPSMITLTKKGAKYLMQNGVAWAGQILGAILKWSQRRDKRFPHPPIPKIQPPDDYERELKEILRRATKLGYV